MPADDSEAVRKHIQVLRETIDRNRNLDWENYRAGHEFTLIGDSKVKVSQPNEGDYVVAVDPTGAVDCDCYISTRPFGRKSCRHMRAVDAHPRL
jgi:hypothetical protein